MFSAINDNHRILFRLLTRGHYDHTKELRISPRSYFSDTEFNPLNSRKKEPKMAQGRVGGNIITPFVLSDSGRRILVNRGFVSWDYLEPSTRLRGQIEEEHDICGVIRLDDAIALKKKGRQGTDGEYRIRAVNEMAAELGTEPIFIDLTREYGDKHGPVAGQTRLEFPNNHLLYTIHWWLLCLCFCVILLRVK